MRCEQKECDTIDALQCENNKFKNNKLITLTPRWCFLQFYLVIFPATLLPVYQSGSHITDPHPHSCKEELSFFLCYLSRSGSHCHSRIMFTWFLSVLSVRKLWGQLCHIRSHSYIQEDCQVFIQQAYFCTSYDRSHRRRFWGRGLLGCVAIRCAQ